LESVWCFYIQNRPWAALLFFSDSAQPTFFLFSYPRSLISLSLTTPALQIHSPLLFFSSRMAQMSHTSGPAQPSCFYQSPTRLTRCARPGLRGNPPPLRDTTGHAWPVFVATNCRLPSAIDRHSYDALPLHNRARTPCTSRGRAELHLGAGFRGLK
jgi:hypothetical protein